MRYLLSAWVIAHSLLTASAHADQLPAPPSPHEHACAIMFHNIEDTLRNYRDTFYLTGIRDRDDLVKRMVAFAEDQNQLVPGVVTAYRQYCPDDARNFPAAAVRALAYHVIAERFGDAK